MKAPKTIPEMREGLAYIFAGALNGDVKMEEGRLALNAATRIIESMQAETRARALAYASGLTIPDAIPLATPMFTTPLLS